MMISKSDLRKKYLELRSNLSPEEYEEYNQRICENFLHLSFLSNITILHTFLPIVSRSEPDTWKIINELRSSRPNVQICVPVVNEDNELDHILFDKKTEMRTSKWGIPEPKKGEHVSIEKIDAVIVPLLSFDRKGNRLGYGKAFYDRFLKDLSSSIPKIGLCNFDPEPVIPTEEHDVKISHCVTPSKIYNFEST